MPQLKTYTVTRTQTLEVRSTDIHKAILAAEAYLDEKSITADVGSVRGGSAKTTMNAEEH